MKKINFTLAAMAAAVCFGFSACETIDMDRSVLGEDEPELIENGDMEITFNCSMAEVEDGTKTEFHDNTIWWSIGDIAKFAQYASVKGEMTYKSTSNTGLTTAKETLSVSVGSFNTPDEGTDSYYMSVFPASSHIGYSTSSGNVRMIMKTPETQTPSLTSFDPAADLLISEYQKNLEKNGEGKYSVSLQYKRMVALPKMTIKNLPSAAKINSIQFSAQKGSSNVLLAGQKWYDFVSGETTSTVSAEKKYSITLDYSDVEGAASGMTAYFCCYPFELADGDSFTVTVTTEAGEIFAKNVTIPAGRELVFEEGRGTRFSVDMSTAEKTSEWFTLDKSSSANTIDKVYCGLSKDSDFTGTMSSIKFTVVKKDNYDPSADYLSTSGSFVSDSGLSKFNSGETVNLSGSSLTIDTEYVFIVKCTTSDGKTCQITRTERTDWWKLALVGRSDGGVQIQITGIGLSTQTKNFRVVETSVLPDNAEGIEEYYTNTLAPGAMPTSYLDGINGKNGASAYLLGTTKYYTDKTNTATMVAGTSYTVMIKATNTRGETEFKYASANAK